MSSFENIDWARCPSGRTSRDLVSWLLWSDQDWEFLWIDYHVERFAFEQLVMYSTSKAIHESTHVFLVYHNRKATSSADLSFCSSILVDDEEHKSHAQDLMGCHLQYDWCGRDWTKNCMSCWHSFQDYPDQFVHEWLLSSPYLLDCSLIGGCEQIT